MYGWRARSAAAVVGTLWRRTAVRAERVSAAAVAAGVGVLHAEAAAHHALHVIELRAAQERPTARIYHHAHAAILEQHVAFHEAVLDGHAVLVAAAAAGADEHADGGVLLAAVRDEARRLLGAGVGEAEPLRFSDLSGVGECVHVSCVHLLHGTTL